jgi:predicted flap endonuclease-1-like 5' DNA nuclease
LLIGAAVSLIIWYWQKSTSAEEGALAVLDRLAEAEARVRELERQLRLADEQGYVARQPEVLAGISQLWGLEASTEERSSTVFPDEVATSVAPAGQVRDDDLKQINGIGPTYERRLKEAGISTLADLAQQTPENLAAALGSKSVQLADPEKWIAEAQSLVEA